MTLVRAAFVRVVRSRSGLATLGGWWLVTLAAATRLRSLGATNGAEQVLRGVVAAVVVPLLAYGVVAAALGGRGLGASVRGLVALGAAPRRAGLAATGVAVALSALAGGFVAAAACVLAHGVADPPLAADAPLTFLTALLAGGAYGAYFCAGSTFGGGAGRSVLLAFDWIFGGAAGFAAIFTPRGHVASLFGGPLCYDLPRRASSAALVVLLAVGIVVAVRRASRRPPLTT